MTEIGRTLLFPSQLICMDSKTRDILSISVISADLRIKSARKSSGMEHHLRPLCCSSAVESFTVGGIPIVNIFLSNELSGFSQRHTYPKIGCGTNTYIPGTFLRIPQGDNSSQKDERKEGFTKTCPIYCFIY